MASRVGAGHVRADQSRSHQMRSGCGAVRGWPVL